MITLDFEAVRQVVLEAGTLLMDREAAGSMVIKGKADFVTEVDYAVQQYIREKLEALYPQVQFLSEEKTNEDVDLNGLVWVLDPVDGTTNLIHDYRASAISLALMEKGVSVMGIIYNPYQKEMYTAQAGKGAYCNGKPIHVSSIENMEESLISIGTSPYYKELMQQNFETYKRIFTDCVDIRRMGSAAVDLADAASGRIEAYFERRLKLWDFAAGMLIITEAGGQILNMDGGPVRCDMVEDIVAGNPAIVKLLVEKYL